MPNFDGSGPNGAGAMTGKRRGNCTGGGNTGGGFFRGRGMGQGNGQGAGRQTGNVNEINLTLEEQETILENRLQAIKEAKKNEK